jgi:hypothetical protein
MTGVAGRPLTMHICNAGQKRTGLHFWGRKGEIAARVHLPALHCVHARLCLRAAKQGSNLMRSGMGL